MTDLFGERAAREGITRAKAKSRYFAEMYGGPVIEGEVIVDEVAPNNFIQWKGTDVCIDLTCSCGRSTHYDGDFLYAWKCPCGKIWEMGDEVPMKEVDPVVGQPPCMQDFSDLFTVIGRTGATEHGHFEVDDE